MVKIGLSWPSLSKALGRPVADPSRWAVLYLGSAKVADLDTDREIVAINRKGEIEPNQRAILSDIEGIVLLDGTWSQAKALWWRNAWMLKCQRVILGPKRPSRYGKLRREPRRDGLSTIEAAAMLLAGLEKRPGYRGDAERQFRADAGKIPAGAGHDAGTRPETEEAGLSPAKTRLTIETDQLCRGSVAYRGEGVYECAPMGPRGGVVTQRSAKPCTPVQFWSWPPFT